MTLQHNDNHPFPPYPAYKDSGVEWLNEMPEEWNKTRLAFVGKFSKGRGIARKDLTVNGVPVILYGDIYTKYGIQTEKLIHASSEEIVANSEKILTGDLLLTGSGETREDIGKCVVYTGADRAYAGGDIIILRPSKIHSVFLSYALNSPHLIREKAKLAKGEIVIHIYSSQLRTISIPLPPYSEQTIIAHFLDHKTTQIDDAIDKHRQLIELLREHRAALINEAVTKGLNPNAPMKDSGVEWIGEVPAHWELVKLKYLTRKIIDGTHFTPNYTEKGVPFIRVTDLKNDIIDLSKTKYISKEEHEELSRRCNPEKGDVLLSKNGTIGITKVVDWDYEFSLFVSVCLIKFTDRLNPYFFSFLFSSNVVDQQIKESSKTTSVTNLHLDKIRELLSIVPPINEQHQIITYIETETTRIDREIDLAQQEIALLEEYRQSLIAEAVSGKIDVRDYVLEDD
ncbi:restriction endonuclease subunit S [Phaeodactylibacter luteus]|uniref:Restriction endonuclease subunit S n=1 Tax=Phaeodactylibacter luteus TaxID=1564516 RepID=A0A5C6RIC6_9BACT|nr:restriction endonuclease subunit S [Phaeodactylibacter luteus]TXB61719.1 restriction endonuclease subunit S [Phaeodactylibacter luteus]